MNVRTEQSPDASVGVARRFVVNPLRRRELPLESLQPQLEETLWERDVLESELAEVAKLELHALEVLDDPGCRIGDEDLASVCRGADSGRSMDTEAEVASVVQKRLRSMEAHPYAELQAFWPLDGVEPPLDVHGCRNCIGRAVEGGKVGVPLRVDDVTCVGPARVLDQAAVLRADLAVAVPSERKSSVDPSMSVNRKVTVPRGSSASSPPGDPSGKDVARELGDRVHLELLAGHLGQHLVGGHAHPGLPELADERAGLALREPVVAEALAQVRPELRLERPRAQVAGDVEARVDVGEVVGRGGLDLQRVAEQLDVAVRELRRVVRLSGTRSRTGASPSSGAPCTGAA